MTTDEFFNLPDAASALHRALYEAPARAQAFFAQLADSLRTPHASEPYREFVKALLLRAEEAKLYTPEAK